MERTYVSDIVGNDYKHWEKGENILINTPTGSGKTYFIIHSLLPYAVEKRMHLIYVCNRTALRNQTCASAKKSFLQEFDYGYRPIAENYFHITTYQHLEHCKTFPDFIEYQEEDSLDEELSSKNIIRQHIYKKDLLFYVFDEAHYFIQDASFNLESAYWNSSLFENKNWIGVFLTATPEQLKMFFSFTHESWLDNLEKWAYEAYKTFLGRNITLKTPILDDPYAYKEPFFYLIEHPTHTPTDLEKKRIREKNSPFQSFFYKLDRIRSGSLNPLKSYHYKPDYTYVTPYYFKDYPDLIEHIIRTVKSNEKWMIFVDSYENGKALQKTLQEASEILADKEQVVFLNANNKKSGKTTPAQITYEQICDEEKFDCPVLITTSLLDNGVNIKDTSLRHMVISATSKTTFLQMLGRLRRETNDQTLNLYIKSTDNLELYGYIRSVEPLLITSLILLFKNKKITYEHITTQTSPSTYEILHEFFYAADNSLLRKTIYTLTHKLKNIAPLLIDYYTQNNNGSDIVSLKPNIPYFLHYLYQRYYYEKALGEKKSPLPPYAYLREQLNWLGKTYDVSQWLGYNSAIDDLQYYLEEKYTAEVYMDKTEQQRFCSECFEYLQKLPVLPETLRASISRYSVFKPPKMNLLNKTFLELNLPYTIQSKTRGKNHETVWKIIDTDPLELLLQKNKGVSFDKAEIEDFIHECSFLYFEKKSSTEIKAKWDSATLVCEYCDILTNDIFPQLKYPYSLIFDHKSSLSGVWHLVKNSYLKPLVEQANTSVPSSTNKPQNDYINFRRSLKDLLIKYPFLPEKSYDILIQYQNEKFPLIEELDSILDIVHLPFLLFIENSKYPNLHIIPTQLRIYLAYLCHTKTPISVGDPPFFINCVEHLLKIYKNPQSYLYRELMSFKENLCSSDCTFENTYILSKNFCYLNINYDFLYDKEKNHFFVDQIQENDYILRFNHFDTMVFDSCYPIPPPLLVSTPSNPTLLKRVYSTRPRKR